MSDQTKVKDVFQERAAKRKAAQKLRKQTNPAAGEGDAAHAVIEMQQTFPPRDEHFPGPREKVRS